MIYQLVLITNLGVITPLATFDQRLDCIREQAYIQKSQQYSAACLPANSPEQAAAQAEQGFKIMLQMMDRMKQEMK
jgi:hypothetical protein